MEAEIPTSPKANWLQVLVIGRKPKRTLIRVLVILGFMFVVFNPVDRFKYAVLLPIRVEGVSMFPTYQNHRINMVNRIPYWFREPRHGDVVAVRTSGTRIMYMKRIVGIPGESIGFHRGRVVINGRQIDEPYVKLPSNWEHEPRVLGPDEYYIVGDNRSMAWEDHTKGTVSRARIIGKVVL